VPGGSRRVLDGRRKAATGAADARDGRAADGRMEARGRRGRAPRNGDGADGDKSSPGRAAMGGRGGRPRRAADERPLRMAATGGGRAAAAEGRDWQRMGEDGAAADSALLVEKKET